MKTIFTILLFFTVATGASAQVPLLSSYPSIKPTLFLDFDGQYVSGTSWNWSGPINAQPATLTTQAITEIYERVAEDFRIFNVNVTTDSTYYWAATTNRRMRVIITPTNQWYGNGAGGISWVGSFGYGDNTPCWVFSNLLGNSVKNIAECISHEAGHTLGLQHQSFYTSACAKTEYNPGTGAGQIGWAPIMGVSYYQNQTTWYNGTSTISCSSYQNDISVIAGYVGLRTDDVGNTHTGAATIITTAIDFNTSGLINSASDKDVFKFTLTSPTNVKLSAVPQSVNTNNAGANLDIRVSLLDNKADTIGQYNPADLLNAGVDSNLNSGTYYVVVEGVANAYTADYSSVGYYAVTGSIGATLPIHRLTLSGRVDGNVHALNWIYQADEAVKAIEVQYSKDGVHYDALTQLGPEAKTFSWKPFNKSNGWYRVRVITVADERSYYSNIIALRDEATNNGPVQIMNNIIASHIAVNTNKEFTYQLMDATGRLLQRGQLVAGTNRIDVHTAQKGLLLLRVQGDNESYTSKLIKQ
jgi:hypothetical protein